MTDTVLFVDDDPALRDSLRRALHRQPWTMRWAADADEALSILDGEPVAAVVTDERMPGMDGLDFLAEIRRRHPAVATVMLTGSASVGLVVRALNEGRVLRFLLKPASSEEIAAAVEFALAHRRFQAALADALVALHRASGIAAGARPAAIDLAGGAGLGAAAAALQRAVEAMP